VVVAWGSMILLEHLLGRTFEKPADPDLADDDWRAA